jgi:hypothetical protein
VERKEPPKRFGIKKLRVTRHEQTAAAHSEEDMPKAGVSQSRMDEVSSPS